MTTPGSTQVDFRLRQFTLQEACDVSGIEPATMRNWLARNTVEVGEKHRLGRWLFSGVDIMKLKVIGDLIKLTRTDPSAVVPIALMIEERFNEMSMRNAGETTLEIKQGYRNDLRIIVILDQKNDVGAIKAQWNGNTYAFPVRDLTGAKTAWARKPHIVIPADPIILDTMNALFGLLGLHADE